MFALARELGMTVRQLLNNLDAAELTEWWAFFRVEEQNRKDREKGKKSPDQLTEHIKASFRKAGYPIGKNKPGKPNN